MERDRYLTPESKTLVLAEWEETKIRFAAYSQTASKDSLRGGRGYPDPPIFEWCDRLNLIEGLVTMQSCTGHRIPAQPTGADLWDQKDRTYPGHLWLWLSKEFAVKFNVRAFDLFGAIYEPSPCEPQLVFSVRRLYQPYGKEILDIQFRGLAESKEVFTISMTHLSEFFESVEGGRNDLS